MKQHELCIWGHTKCPSNRRGYCLVLKSTNAKRYDCPFFHPKAARKHPDPKMSVGVARNALKQRSPCESCANDTCRENNGKTCGRFEDWVRTSLIALRRVTGIAVEET